MADRAEKSRRDRREPHPLAVLAGVLAAFLLLAACYVGYQALHILFPQNVYETALPATVSDNVEADGVLLFDEVYVSGSGTLGYLAADGERVSAGTAVAEIYSDASQAVLRQQLTQLTEQIDLLQRSQNTTSLQLDALLRERSAALYDMMDELDAGAYDEVSSGANAYLLAQNKLWIATGDSANFTDQVTALTQQAQSVQAQLGNPTQITAPQTGYFVRASSSGRLNAGADDILAQDPAQLKAYLDSNPTLPLDGCAAALGAARGVKGRIEVVPTPTDYTVLIDYAHTPDALENILTTVRDFTPGRVICLFGCGGDRDRTKRPRMGAVAGALADVAVVTSDNPRTEVPMDIINDILPGLEGAPAEVVVEPDRRAAIRRALSLARAGDTVVLAGKGHETYQEVDGVEYHLDEREEIAAYFA